MLETDLYVGTRKIISVPITTMSRTPIPKSNLPPTSSLPTIQARKGSQQYLVIIVHTHALVRTKGSSTNNILMLTLVTFEFVGQAGGQIQRRSRGLPLCGICLEDQIRQARFLAATAARLRFPPCGSRRSRATSSPARSLTLLLSTPFPQFRCHQSCRRRLRRPVAAPDRVEHQQVGDVARGGVEPCTALPRAPRRESRAVHKPLRGLRPDPVRVVEHLAKVGVAAREGLLAARHGEGRRPRGGLGVGGKHLRRR
mmetsp:Transcript_36200/g.77196  ORF Transcript_36200/g.77196 Transcript_36200/m.77196 type:complete len:255 (+) Transcript_36200:110-874(+)